MFPEQNKNIHKVLWHKEQELETKMSWEGEVDQNSFSISFISGANDHSLIKMLLPIGVWRQKFFIIV